VFVINDSHIPGGALGIAARDEILSVVEVHSNGVLVLQNQGGRRFTKHIEQCVPCALTNVDGTIHPELLKPSWKFPCSVCGDHRQSGKMLLCDGCNLGFHTFCLAEPLEEVPQGLWICPSCLTAGVTEEQIIARRAKYIPSERSRPNIELPSESRRQRARKLVNEWHGKAVRQTTRKGTKYGRVEFTDVSSEKWFRIHWSDGTSTWHNPRVFKSLEIIQESDAPDTLIHAPEPIKVLTGQIYTTWSILTVHDIRSRLQSMMPGYNDERALYAMHTSIGMGSRKRMTVQHKPTLVMMLTSVINFRTLRVVLDPWAANKLVEQGITLNGSHLVLNDKLGRKDTHLQMEPLESALYYRVIRAFGRLDAIVAGPPEPLSDFALVNAIEFAAHLVCLLLPSSWLSHAHFARQRLLDHLEHEGRLLVIHDADPRNSYIWVCCFASREDKLRLVFDDMQCDTAHLVVTATQGMSI
jgi:PHD-finger